MNHTIALHNRLDILVKYLFVHAYKTQNNYPYFEKLYLKHIKLQNGYKEDDKKSSRDFISNFQELIDSMQKDGYISKRPIIIGKDETLIDGAHRYACCLYFAIDPPVKHVDNKGISRNIDRFVKNNFSQEEILQILHIYAALSGDEIAILWPTCSIPQSIKSLHISYNIALDSAFFWSEYIQDIYAYDEKMKTSIGIKNKIGIMQKYGGITLLFLKKDFDKSILRNNLLEHVHDMDVLADEKKYFTIHSGDTENEKSYLKNMLTSANYYKHLYMRPPQIDSHLLTLLQGFDAYESDMVIVGSGPIGIYNINYVSDIDVISTNPKNTGIITLQKNVDLLDYQYHHTLTNQEILSNDRYYFNYRGFKFLSLQILMEVKKRGLRKKDQEQAIKIQNLLQKNYIHTKMSLYTQLKQYAHYKSIRIFVTISHIGISITKKLGIYQQVSSFWRTYILTKFR